MGQPEDGHPRGAAANSISNASVRTVREFTGRGPTKAKTVINRDSVTVLFEDTMTKAETGLIAAGKSDLVLQMRREIQRTMADALIAIVEGVMQRKVIAFMSDNHVEPDMAVEVFVLEPRPDEPGSRAGPEHQSSSWEAGRQTE
jgi:uncharacterized protein YbcI